MQVKQKALGLPRRRRLEGDAFGGDVLAFPQALNEGVFEYV